MAKDAIKAAIKNYRDKQTALAAKFTERLVKEASVFVDHRHLWDELDDVKETVKEMKKLTGKRYHIRRRGRGIRKCWGECYRSYLPLNKSNYMAVYIVGVK